MADASVGIRVDYSQLQAAQKSAENLKSDLRELAREKVSLAGDFRDALTEAERLRAVVKDLNNTIKTAEKGGGKALAEDYIKQAAAVKDLAKAEENLRSIRADQRTNQSLIDMGKQELSEAKERVKAEQELTAAMEKRRQSAMEAENASLQKMREEIALAQQLAQAKRDAEAAAATQRARDEGRIVSVNLEEQAEAARKAQEAQEALRKAEAEEQAQLAQSQRDAETERLNQQAEAAERVRSVLQGISTVMGAGASVSNFLGDFASGIGNSFSGMAQMFGNNNVSTAITRFLTYNALRGITNNVSGIVSRYDIMSTFLPYMEVAGVGSDAAQVALDRVNQAILGLPIGLDESAQRLRRYQMFLGNVDDATNLTIGAQNAILAGGASEQMKNMAYMQIDRLLAAGRLNTARQWLSLIQGMGVSMRFISEQMGTTGMDVRDLAAGLASGAIDAREFLNALMELGKGESEAAQGLETTLEIYKGTIEAWINNIQFAATRGGENILKSLNQTLVDATGQGITGYMKEYRDFMNSVFGKPGEGGISGWITDNSSPIVEVMSRGRDLIDAVSRFSASQTGGLILENTGRLFEGVATALNSIPDGKLEEFVAFATTLAGPLASAFSASSGLGQMIGVFERFQNFDFNMLISDLSDAVGLMADLVNKILSIVDDEVMSKILAYGLVFGKPVGSILGAGASAFSSLAMMRLAFPSLFGGAAAGAATAAGAAGNTALGSWALSGGFSLWPTLAAGAQALSPVLASMGAGALAARVMNDRDAAMASDIMNAGGLAYGYSPVDASEALIKSADAIYSRWTSNEFSRSTKSAQDAIRESIEGLEAEYDYEQAYLQALKEKREEYSDQVRNNPNLTASERRGYDAAVKDIDRQIPLVEAAMAGLNAKILEQGVGLNDLVITYGDYEVRVTDVGNKLKDQSEKVIPEYIQRMNELSAAVSETVNNAKERLPGELAGFGGIEYPDTPKGGFTADNTKNLEEKAEAVEDMAKNLNTVNEYLKELTPGSKEGENLIGYMNEILDIEDLGERAAQLQAVADALGGENGISKALEAFEHREGAESAFSTALDDFNTTAQQFIGESSSAYQLGTMLAEIAGNMTDFKNSLTELVTGDIDVEKFTTDISGPMDTMATDVKKSTDDTTEAIGTVEPAITGSNAPSAAKTWSEGIAEGAEAGVQRVIEAAAQIAAAIASIDGLSATVSINTVTNTVTDSGGGTSGSLAGESVAMPSATGGPVFKAFGSDTVPYMLTPGEYIIRKGAADFFGRGLLERINALDIGGAFDRLILNSPVTAGRFGGNVYNKDNHASVVQNYYNSSPDYGNRRAWRFAHSL